MAQSASKSCDICMSGPGRNFCDQCDQWMCENCKTLHLRSKISRNHTFRSGSNHNREEKSFCKEHDESFIFYCIDCDMPICKICSIKTHTKHDMSEINESTQELQAEVNRFIDSRIKSIKTNLDKMEVDTGKYQSDVNDAIRVITEDGKQMKQSIDKKVQALISSLEEKETANLKRFQAIRTEFQNDLRKFEKYQTALTDSKNVVDASKLLTQLKKTKFELGVEGEKQPPVMPTIMYFKKDVSERKIFNLFGFVSFEQKVISLEQMPKKKTSEIVNSVEQTPKKMTRQQPLKTIHRYECPKCGEKKLSVETPIYQPEDFRKEYGQGNTFNCGTCGYAKWFLVKKEK